MLRLGELADLDDVANQILYSRQTRQRRSPIRVLRRRSLAAEHWQLASAR